MQLRALELNTAFKRFFRRIGQPANIAVFKLPYHSFDPVRAPAGNIRPVENIPQHIFVRLIYERVQNIIWHFRVLRQPQGNAPVFVPVLNTTSLKIDDVRVVLLEVRPTKVGTGVHNLYQFRVYGLFYWVYHNDSKSIVPVIGYIVL